MNFLQNKQAIHIISEVVVLLGITYYFTQKNKILMNHIEDLANRMEELEEKLVEQGKIIKQLVQFINTGYIPNKNVPKKPTQNVNIKKQKKNIQEPDFDEELNSEILDKELEEEYLELNKDLDNVFQDDDEEEVIPEGQKSLVEIIETEVPSLSSIINSSSENEQKCQNGVCEI